VRRKIIVSISLFIFLFVGAWLLNYQTKRDYIRVVLEETESIGDYIFTPTEAEADTWDFKSREYIKVRKRHDF